VPGQESSRWHAVSAEACLNRLSSTAAGLSSDEAKQRLASAGPNQLALQQMRSNGEILLQQLTNPMLVLLLTVALVSFWIDLHQGRWSKDAIAILMIVVLNALLGFVQESKAEQALLALRGMGDPLVQVRRDSAWQQLGSSQLVAGDWIRLEAGDRVAADARLLESWDLRLQEAALTGEGAAVSKQAGCVLAEDTPVMERSNTVFQGTDVMSGRGIAVVVATGMGTELGAIAALLSSAGGERTPLQKRLSALAQALVAGALTLVLLVVLVGRQLGQPLLELLEISLSMAVAIVPEGLPAVITVTLAIGTQRMVRRAALIRRLSAVEGLGSVTVICTDKTGTLTENQQEVVALRVAKARLIVGSDTTATPNLFQPLGAPAPDEVLKLLLKAGVLCSNAELAASGPDHQQALGDPTEVALLTVAEKANLNVAELRQRFKRCRENPFSAETQQMSVWLEDPEGELQAPLQLAGNEPLLMISKGAPEAILAKCERWIDDEGTASLSPQRRQQWLDEARQMAASGLRVLAFAGTPRSSESTNEHSALIWIGLVGELDPPRQEAAEAVATCLKAGIRPVMITGDHPITAQAIAAAIGLADRQQPICIGEELQHCTDQELRKLVRTCNIFARTAPSQKLRIVQALQANGEVVAMTGDGVNDAPALKQAHIGIAMGITGSEVSKEAADMVLLDDNFASIVNAIAEGRLVYTNIRRFVKYILGSNVGELITIGSAPLLGLSGLPLSPLQILWMNLVTDGLPALALAMEPGDPHWENHKPPQPNESIFARGLGRYILRVGLVFALLVITLMLLAERSGSPWPTMVFTTLCLAQMGHALSARSERPLLQVARFSNPWLLAAVLLTTMLQLSLLYVPALSRFFGTTALGARDLAVCVGFSLLLLLYLELDKFYGLWRRREASNC
jgi:Ca2+-transporting ATPase